MKIGTRLISQVCGGEVIVIRAEGTDLPPSAGGLPMSDSAPSVMPPDDGGGRGFLLGKRYEFVDNAAGIRLEILVTKPGTSTLSWNGHELELKPTKPLPASD